MRHGSRAWQEGRSAGLVGGDHVALRGLVSSREVGQMALGLRPVWCTGMAFEQIRVSLRYFPAAPVDSEEIRAPAICESSSREEPATWNRPN